jgi:hypothetical protein
LRLERDSNKSSFVAAMSLTPILEQTTQIV